MKKNILKTLVLTLMLVLVVTGPVLAISQEFPSKNGSITTVDNGVKKLWGSVITVVQILAFAAIVFAGVRYMFAAADQKADIKKGLGMLTVGAILVFAASTVVKFVITAADQII